MVSAGNARKNIQCMHQVLNVCRVMRLVRLALDRLIWIARYVRLAIISRLPITINAFLAAIQNARFVIRNRYVIRVQEIFVRFALDLILKHWQIKMFACNAQIICLYLGANALIHAMT